MKKILITGGSGLLGSNLVRMLRDRFHVFYTYNENYVKFSKCTPIRMNFMREYEISDKLHYIRPDVVVNCAAMTGIRRCEENRELAFHTNIYSAKILADMCSKLGSKLVQISADAVFDGRKGMYTEEDKPNPLNYYSFTKMQAEKMVRRCADSIIVRTNFYGTSVFGNGFSEAVLEKLKNRETVHIPNDVFFTPILVDNLAEALSELLDKDADGTYNVAGHEKITKFDFAKRIANVFGLNENFILPVKMKDVYTGIEIPMDTSLSIEKALSKLNTRPVGINTGLMKIRERMKKDFHGEVLA